MQHVTITEATRITTQSGTIYYFTTWDDGVTTVTRDGDLMFGSGGLPIIAEPCTITRKGEYGECMAVTLHDHPDKAIITTPVVEIDDLDLVVDAPQGDPVLVN